MNIGDFIRNFTNHPVLFVGTGMSLRYLNNSYTWDGLLGYVSRELKGNDEFFYDLKFKYFNNGEYDYPMIASEIEAIFEDELRKDRNGKFADINDLFYKNIENGINISRFKLFITKLLENHTIKEEKKRKY